MKIASEPSGNNFEEVRRSKHKEGPMLTCALAGENPSKASDDAKSCDGISPRMTNSHLFSRC